MTAVAALLVVAGVVAAVAWWADRSPQTGDGIAQPTPTRPTATTTTSSSPVVVESTRDVRVDGKTVTVEEVSNVVEGDAAIAEPARAGALGLRFVGSSVVTPDGRSRRFEAPITLQASGELTVRSRYRLTRCPDILPSQWPPAAEFPDATRSFLRVDGPLHTAYALCPNAQSEARPRPGLTGALASGPGGTVRLTWQGADSLTIRAIGSASGVAALVPDPSCDAACVAQIPPRSAEEIQLQPVDPCPPATRNDTLTILVAGGGGRSTVVRVGIPGLHREICR